MKMIDKIKESKKVAMVKFKVAEKIMEEATKEHLNLIESLAKDASEKEFDEFVNDAASDKEMDFEEVLAAIVIHSTK